VTHKPDVPLGEVAAFLAAKHGRPLASVLPLPGGFWSAAYAYRIDGRDLVLRIGTIPEGFERDRAAMAFSAPDLPVPDVLEIGDAFGVGYAISVRHFGRFLEDVRVEERPRSGPMLGRLLAALRAIEQRPDLAVSGQPVEQAPGDTWRNHLLGKLVDDGTRPTAGWRRALTREPELERLFVACASRIERLLDACPERRDVVHGDLLYGNVLVNDDASAVTAVYSWKRSVRGDFLYDTAYCSFFAAWYAGIGAADPWATSLATMTPAERIDAAARHHCYELTIGAHHLGGYLVTNDTENLRIARQRLGEILERGELSAAPDGAGIPSRDGRDR
jgi:aminoglycoside phosphotransferase (APT) family kinase protein